METSDLHTDENSQRSGKTSRKTCCWRWVTNLRTFLHMQTFSWNLMLPPSLHLWKTVWTWSRLWKMSHYPLKILHEFLLMSNHFTQIYHMMEALLWLISFFQTLISIEHLVLTLLRNQLSLCEEKTFYVQRWFFFFCKFKVQWWGVLWHLIMQICLWVILNTNVYLTLYSPLSPLDVVMVFFSSGRAPSMNSLDFNISLMKTTIISPLLRAVTASRFISLIFTFLRTMLNLKSIFKENLQTKC